MVPSSKRVTGFKSGLRSLTSLASSTESAIQPISIVFRSPFSEPRRVPAANRPTGRLPLRDLEQVKRFFSDQPP